MANDVLIGFELMIVLALVTGVSATQVTMLNSFDGVERCDVMCTTAFADSKASFVVCRSSQVVEMFNSITTVTIPACDGRTDT